MQPVEDYPFYVTKIEDLTRRIKLDCLSAEIEDSFDAYSKIVEQTTKLADEVDKLLHFYHRKAKETFHQ